MRYAFLGWLWTPARCFSVVEHWLGKLHGLEVCRWPLCLFLNPEKKAKAYLYASLLEALCSLYFLYTDCFYHFKHLLTWSKMNRQTNIQTYKHTHTLSDNFRKPGVLSQPAIGRLWACAWFKQEYYLSQISLLSTCYSLL